MAKRPWLLHVSHEEMPPPGSLPSEKTIIQEIEEFLQRPDVDIKGDLTREKLVEMSVGARTLG